jgi:transposase InsO family protein
MGDTPDSWEMSVAEQRYEAGRAVIADGETVKDVAARFGVSRKTLHVWLTRYDLEGLDGLDGLAHRSWCSPAGSKVQPVRVRFDRVCRENGIRPPHPAARSATTTGTIERFHRAIRTEFRTDRAFASAQALHGALDEWFGEHDRSGLMTALAQNGSASRQATLMQTVRYRSGDGAAAAGGWSGEPRRHQPAAIGTHGSTPPSCDRDRCRGRATDAPHAQ